MLTAGRARRSLLHSRCKLWPKCRLSRRRGLMTGIEGMSGGRDSSSRSYPRSLSCFHNELFDDSQVPYFPSPHGRILDDTLFLNTVTLMLLLTRNLIGQPFTILCLYIYFLLVLLSRRISDFTRGLKNKRKDNTGRWQGASVTSVRVTQRGCKERLLFSNHIERNNNVLEQWPATKNHAMA